MKIGEFADILELTLIVKRYHNQENKHIAYLENVELRIKNGNILSATFGTGNTPEEAIEDYCDEIKGYSAVYNAFGENRKEFKIPKNLEP